MSRPITIGPSVVSVAEVTGPMLVSAELRLDVALEAASKGQMMQARMLLDQVLMDVGIDVREARDKRRDADLDEDQRRVLEALSASTWKFAQQVSDETPNRMRVDVVRLVLVELEERGLAEQRAARHGHWRAVPR